MTIYSHIQLKQTSQCNNLINDKLLKNAIFPSNNQQGGVKLPCLSYCEQVITRCIGKEKLEQLNDLWKTYISALNELAMKLSNSYNIETVIRPLDIQISEAIMNFQDNAQNISQHVFSVCGYNQQPASPYKIQHNRLGKRAATLGSRPLELAVNSHNRFVHHAFEGGFHQPLLTPNLGGHFRTAAKNGLIEDSSRLPSNIPPQKSPIIMNEIKNYMSSTKFFWSNLPNSVCTSNQTLVSIPNIINKKQTNCFNESFASTDINTDVRYRGEFGQQLRDLEKVCEKIEKALLGEEIDFSKPADQTVVVHGFIPIGRLPTTTTTTTTTPEPELYGENEDDDDPGEVGSGETEVDEFNDFPPTELDDPDLESTTDSINGESDETNDDTLTTTSSPQPFETETETPAQTNVNSDSSDNVIDPPPQISPEDFHIYFPQRSSQTSSKLVISDGSHMLLFMSIILSIVTYLQSNLTAFRFKQQTQIHLTCR